MIPFEKPPKRPPRKPKRIPFASRRRIAERQARAACTEVVVRRDGGCLFWARVTGVANLEQFASFPHCGGRLVAHEPAHRRNVDYLNPSDAICLCEVHNGFVEQMGQLAYDCGLLVRGNGYPLKHVRIRP